MAIGGQKKPSGDGMPCISPYRAGKKPPVVTGGYLLLITKIFINIIGYAINH